MAVVSLPLPLGREGMGPEPRRPLRPLPHPWVRLYSFSKVLPRRFNCLIRHQRVNIQKLITVCGSVIHNIIEATVPHSTSGS